MAPLQFSHKVGNIWWQFSSFWFICNISNIFWYLRSVTISRRHAFTDWQSESTLWTNITKSHGLITWQPSIGLYLIAPFPLSLSLSPPSQSQPETPHLSLFSIFSHQAHLTVHHWPPCKACSPASSSWRWPSSTSSMAVAWTSMASRRSRASTRYAACRRDACVLSSIVPTCVMLACWCMHASLLCIDVCTLYIKEFTVQPAT